MIWLGLAPRGGWFRGLGYAISVLAAGRLVIFAGSYDPSMGGGVGVFNGHALRDLLCIVTFIVISDRMARRRESLSETEAWTSNFWLVGVNLLLMQWTLREAPHFTRLLLEPGSPAPISGAPAVEPPPSQHAYVTSLGTALAWTIQFAGLILLGFARRSSIQRKVGYAVGAAAFLAYVAAVGTEPRPLGAPIRILPPAAMMLFACAAAFFVMARHIERRRADLGSGEGWAPAIAVLAAHGSWIIWTGLEAERMANVIAPSRPPTYALWTTACMAQTAVLFLLSRRWQSRLQRHTAYAVGAVGLLMHLSAASIELTSRPSADPLTDPAGLLLLASVALLLFAARFLDGERPALAEAERRTPEVATVAANGALMAWSAMEAGRVAHTLAHGASITPSAYDSTTMLAAVLMSAAWVVQAGVLLALGWTRRSPFLRWVGLSLVGFTIVKFVAVDLQRVDIFWRFVIALGVGAVLLLVSFVYQRMARRQAET